MTATDTFLGLLRAVLTDRDDDMPRLVLADWWAGDADPIQPDRAEFVRVQCDLSRLGNELCGFPATHCRVNSVGKWEHVQGCPILAVWRRERELMHKLRDRFRAALPASEPSWSFCLSRQGREFADGWTFGMSRGFPDSLTLPAADWLRVADDVYWHPEQVGPCRECGGEAQRRHNYPAPHGGWRTEWCIACDGAGRVPRECPPTAQPLERVTLTTWPDWEVEGIDAEDWAMMNRASAARLLEREGAKRWPGLTFAITPPAAS